MAISGDIGYIDVVELGNAGQGYYIERTEVGHKPNTKITRIDHRNKGSKEITLEYETAQCGVDIPEMEVIAQNGHTLEVEDVDAWDDDGNIVKGKSYKVTDEQNRQVVIEIVELVQLSPGVQGSFQLEYQGQLI